MLNTIKLYTANGLNERGIITADQSQELTDLLRDNRYDTQWVSTGTPLSVAPITILFEFRDRYGDEVNVDIQKIILQNINIKRAYFTADLGDGETIIALLSNNTLSSVVMSMYTGTFVIPWIKMYITDLFPAETLAKIGQIRFVKPITFSDCFLTAKNIKRATSENINRTRDGSLVFSRDYWKFKCDLDVSNLVYADNMILRQQILGSENFTISLWDNYSLLDVYGVYAKPSYSEEISGETELAAISIPLEGL